MKRIFIALKIEAGNTLLNMISALKSGLKNDSIKWTNPDNIHITLAFLGDTDEKMIKPIISMLYDRCREASKFELSIRGAGVFRNLHDPRIIWTGIDPSDELIKLNAIVMNGLKEFDIKLEDRPFKPHLTIGRIKHLGDSEKLKDLISRFQYSEIQLVPVNEVILFESILLQSGPVYKPLAEVNLK